MPKRTLVAIDADQAGDRATERLVREGLSALRMRSGDGDEDLNAVLKARTSAFPSKQFARIVPRAHVAGKCPTSGAHSKGSINLREDAHCDNNRHPK